MKKHENADPKHTGVSVGNISQVSGSVNIAGENIVTQQTTSGLDPAEVKRLFDQVYAAIENRADTSPADKQDLDAEVKEIQSTVTHAAQEKATVDEGFLARRFRNIARIAPDILDVAVTSLGSPLAGLGLVARKIAEKAKRETNVR